MWISADPALGEYLPVAPLDDHAKKHNQQLPGQGGVFNLVNLNLYHYAANNPVKYVDPDGNRDVDFTPDQLKRMEILTFNQDSARANSDYAPGSGGPFNLPPDPTYTWCNQATFDVNLNTGIDISGMISPEDRWNTTADEAAQRISASSNFKQVNAKDAQLLANRGYTVTAIWTSTKKGEHGHMATVRPNPGQFDATKGPWVSNVGSKNILQFAIDAFGKSRIGSVRYYYCPSQFYSAGRK